MLFLLRHFPWHPARLNLIPIFSHSENNYSLYYWGGGAAVYRLEHNETSWSKKPIKQFFAKIFSRGTYARGVGGSSVEKEPFCVARVHTRCNTSFLSFSFFIQAPPCIPFTQRGS